MAEQTKSIISFYYFEIAEIWKKFCELHSLLFDLTCNEYNALLSNDIELLQKIIKEKEDLNIEIKQAENARKKIINEINNQLPTDKKINHISDLLSLMANYEKNNGDNFLEKYNLLLIDIIERLIIQNKKNQLFINKSQILIKEITEELLGQKKFQTYNAQGQT